MRSEAAIRDLQVLEDMQDHGIPVFCCRLQPNTVDPAREGGHPSGWQRTRAHQYDVFKAAPGSAFGVVTGHGLDVLDVDPKNGADIDVVHATILDSGIPIVGISKTPSGGRHYYVSSIGRRKQQTIDVGLDFLGGESSGEGRAFAYAPGTVRPKYPEGRYEWIKRPDLRLLGRQVDRVREFFDSLLGESSGSSLAGVTQLTTDVTGVAAAVALVLASVEGSRNATLYLASAKLGNLGLVDDQIREKMISAGVQTGLLPGEAKAAVDGGMKTGSKRLCAAVSWAQTVTSSGRLVGGLSSSMSRTISVLFDMFVLHGSSGVGISSRRLGEDINCSAHTANKNLRKLVDGGFLVKEKRRSGGFSPDEFSIPGNLLGDEGRNASKGDSQITSSLVTNSSLSPVDCHLLSTSAQRVRDVQGHSALTRAPGEVSLPPSAAPVLVAIEDGATTVQAIQQVSDSTPGTIRRTLKILESAGLVTYTKRHPIVVRREWSREVENGLDLWCKQKGIADRTARRRRKHAKQRQDFRDGK